MICGAPVPLNGKELPPEQAWPVTGFVPLVRAPLAAVVPGSVPGVVGDTGVSIGAGTVMGALGGILKTGGGGGGAPIAPIWAVAETAPAKTRMAANAAD